MSGTVSPAAVAEVPSVLPWLTGAWVRSARTYGGGPPTECSDVVWVQVGPWFADFRLPRPGASSTHPYDRARAFSGVLDVRHAEGTTATVEWHHDLDTDRADSGPGDAGPDAGTLVLGGGLLIETGEGYVEWWSRPAGSPERLTGPPREWVAEHLDAAGAVDARMVSADGMAAAVWGTGGAWCDETSGWAPTRLTGAPCPFELSAVAAAAVRRAPLPDGWRRQEAP